MLLKLSEMFGITRSLPKLAEKELPVKISYRLMKLLKQCSLEMETLEEARVKLVEKYSEKVEGEDQVKVSDENTEKFQKEFGDLLAEEVEVDFDPIDISDLGDIPFSTNDLVPLEKIIKG
jgi:hypothetical protein